MLAGLQDGLAVVGAGTLVGVVTEHDAVRVAGTMLNPQILCGEAATFPVQTVTSDTPAHVALATMQVRMLRHLLVLDGGTLAAVVSLRDLLVDDPASDTTMTVEEVVRQRKVETIRADQPLVLAAQRMMRGIGCLPVMSPHGTIAGILTRTDIVRAALPALQDAFLFD